MTRIAILVASFGLVPFLTALGAADEPKQNGEDAKRDALWAALKKTKHEAVQKIDCYGENPSLTEVCFSADKQVYIFTLKEGKVRGLVFMKVLPKINRITFRQDKELSMYLLWADGKVEMEFAGNK
jgi:hypothetical protein